MINAIRNAICLLFVLFLVGCTPVPTVQTHDPQPSQTSMSEVVSLSEQDLQHYEQVFSFSLEPFNWYRQSLVATYDCPENLDLAVFFGNGIGTQMLTNNETKFIEQAKIDPGFDIARISVAEASTVLEQCFCITWDETNGIGLDRLLHNEQENCYYVAANGPNILEMLDIHSGTKTADGTVCLIYTQGGLNQEWRVTFVEQDSSSGVFYRFLSNVPHP